MPNESKEAAANSAPAGGSAAREPDGPPRGRTPERGARRSFDQPQAWGDHASAAGPAQGRPRERGEAEARRARPQALTAAVMRAWRMPNERREAAWNSAPQGQRSRAR